MKYSEATQGRIFIIRLEDGDILHKEIEAFAEAHSIKCAFLSVLGGVDCGSKLITGPEEGRSKTITPIEHKLDNVHEITGTGTLFPDTDGKPVLHMHISCGRKNGAVTGCIRNGVITWHVIEVIMVELLNTGASRKPDSAIGFSLLSP